jgi:UDP-GlcNAc:undecaprenyl-phosphate GlcNAc-1-phosphate transferase
VTVLCLGFASSLLFSFVLTKLVRDLALRKQWTVYSGEGRHVHNTPTPRLGGVAVALSFLLGTLFALLITRIARSGPPPPSLKTLAEIGPAAVLIFLLGIYDDVRSAGPYLKFSVEAIAGTLLFSAGLRIATLPVLFGSHQFSGYTSLLLTIGWVIAITNAFNLIDGLDGLAAGSALFSTMVVFVVALVTHMTGIALITVAVAGAILGFLRFNFNPATIFLGDCGSLFIGFMLSALALCGAQKSSTIIAVAIPIVSFGLPILETSLSVLRRWISGRPLFGADCEHIHHKLLQRGMSQRQVVVVLYGVSAVFALLSLFLLFPGGSTVGLVLAVLGTGIWIGVQHLGYLEFGELRRVAQRTIEQRQIFVNNLAIRRAAEELRSVGDFEALRKVLNNAFSENDFDGFELRAELPTRMEGITLVQPRICPRVRWIKPGSQTSPEFGNAWSLNLDLVSANIYCGALLIFRRYTRRHLQLDINLLTSDFAGALADALQRITTADLDDFFAGDIPALLEVRAG